MQKHLNPRELEGAAVWLASAKYRHDDDPGQPGVVRQARDQYLVLHVGGDLEWYDHQFPPREEIYGQHPDAVGSLDELHVVLTLRSRDPVEDTPDNARRYHRYRRAHRRHLAYAQAWQWWRHYGRIRWRKAVVDRAKAQVATANV